MIILGTNSIKDTGYDVANSLRFNKGDDPELSRSTGDGNERIGMFSFWTKTDDEGVIYEITTDSNNFFDISVDGNRRFQVRNKASGSYNMELLLTRQFRDPSAWTHFFIAIDTTQSTESNRVKIFINGVQDTTFNTSTYPSQNDDLFMNANSKTAKISGTSGVRFNGYLAEFVLIDGTVKAVTDFGEFDEDSGIWKPIDVSGLSGDKGVNGFYLDFEDSSALGNCAFGGTDFTVSNLAATDQSTDTCTNNFATLNPLNVPTSNAPTFSEGNLQSVSSSSDSGSFGGSSSIGVSSGKWYIETKCLTSGHTQSSVGVTYNDAETARTNNDATDSYEYSYRMNGNKQHDNTDSSYGDTYTTNDIIGIALDLDNNKIYFSKNGTFQNSGNPESGSTGTGAAFTVDSGQTYMFYHQDNTGASSNTSSVSFNFGSPAFAISSGNTDGNGYGNFEYAVPSGYYSLNTKNLAEYG
jgi:hypothetical protein